MEFGANVRNEDVGREKLFFENCLDGLVVVRRCPVAEPSRQGRVYPSDSLVVVSEETKRRALYDHATAVAKAGTMAHPLPVVLVQKVNIEVVIGEQLQDILTIRVIEDSGLDDQRLIVVIEKGSRQRYSHAGCRHQWGEIKAKPTLQLSRQDVFFRGLDHKQQLVRLWVPDGKKSARISVNQRHELWILEREHG